MLLMEEKGIRGRICHCICQYAKANSKYMKEHGKNKESSYLQSQDVNNIYSWAMQQKLPVMILSGSKKLLNLMKMSKKL